MTFKEKLMQEHPDSVSDRYWGGCKHCPNWYGYGECDEECVPSPENCTECWNREIPGTENDSVNHPSHYTDGGMECIDEMIMIFGRKATMHFCLCNAWKYRRRAMYKNGEEDMQKSHWYLAKYKELMGGE